MVAVIVAVEVGVFATCVKTGVGEGVATHAPAKKANDNDKKNIFHSDNHALIMHLKPDISLDK